MTELIERVAVALMDTATAPHFRAVWADQPDEVKTHWRFAARAAIEAIREPPTEMLKIAAATWDDDWCTETNALHMWNAMVEEALKP